MANEITVISKLRIAANSGAFLYQNAREGFSCDLITSNINDPTPGGILVTVRGTDIDLSELTTPGMCIIANNDDTNFLTFGIWDPETSKFYPLGEVGPQEHYVLKLSRELAQEFGTGTGTTGPTTNTLRLKADTAAVYASISAFEK